MGLSAAVLAESAFAKYREKMEEQHPNVVKSRKMSKIPRADGSVDYAFQEDVGPIEVRREAIMPLLSALAEAIVEHVEASAEVYDNNLGAPTLIGRVE